MTHSSQTQIVNQALAEIGSTTRLNSLSDDQSETAQRAKAMFPLQLRDLLESHPWNFALRRAQLNEFATPPVHGWERAFQLPADCVRWLPPSRDEAAYFDGEQEGNLLLSNAEAPLLIRYISYVDDTSKWPGSFALTMVYRMAVVLVEGATGSKGTKDRMEEKSLYQLRMAKRRDGLATGQRQRGRVLVRSDLLAARNRAYFHGNR